MEPEESFMTQSCGLPLLRLQRLWEIFLFFIARVLRPELETHQISNIEDNLFLYVCSIRGSGL